MAEYDYSLPGAYFVTISTNVRKPLFGKIKGDEVDLSEHGKIAKICWQEIPQHFSFVELEEFIVMPNHLHGILWILDSKDPDIAVGARHASPLSVRATHASPLRPTMAPSGPRRASIGAIIGSYKSSVSRIINLNNRTKMIIWQRNYYEHVIRDYPELDSIRNYILNNAAKGLPQPFQKLEKPK